jgi:Leucine-rich repeat (LRR) protein
MIVLVLVFGGGMGWLVRSARIQRTAAAAVKSVGGQMMYDWEWNKSKGYTGSTYRVPQWVADRIGVDYFGHISSIWLYAPSTDTDAALAPVGRLIQLEQLVVNGSKLTDNGLAKLKDLTSLSRLDLDYTKISDNGLANLQGLKNLSALSLNGTSVTDAGLSHLQGLTKLAELNLAGTHITDAGLAHLKGLTHLTVLNVVNTKITDAGMIELMRARPGLRAYR